MLSPSEIVVQFWLFDTLIVGLSSTQREVLLTQICCSIPLLHIILPIKYSICCTLYLDHSIFFCFCALFISDNQIYFYGNRKSVNAWFPNKKYNFSKFAFLVLFWIYRCGCIYFHLFVQLCDLNSLIYIDDRERTLPYTVNIVIYDLLLLTSFLFSTGICPIFIVFLRKSWCSVCNETRWVCIPFKRWYIFSALRSFDWKFTVWQRGW